MLKQIILRIAVVIFVAALAPAAASAAASPAFAGQQAAQAEWVSETATANWTEEGPQQQTEPVETRLYTLNHVSLDSGYTLAFSVSREIVGRPNTTCNIEALEEEGTLVVTATAAIHERVASLLAEVDKPPHTQTFHIIVLAATDSPSTPSDLPPGAQRAVEDIKAFLPYEGFRVLDTGWLKTARYGRTSLTGPTGFNVELRFRGNPESGEPILIEGFEMSSIEENYTVNGELNRVHKSIVDTSFSISVGETVVVGTSKLNGDEEPTALVILLTALEPEGAR